MNNEPEPVALKFAWLWNRLGSLPNSLTTKPPRYFVKV
jgi:hypothetical protein